MLSGAKLDERRFSLYFRLIIWPKLRVDKCWQATGFWRSASGNTGPHRQNSLRKSRWCSCCRYGESTIRTTIFGWIGRQNCCSMLTFTTRNCVINSDIVVVTGDGVLRVYNEDKCRVAVPQTRPAQPYQQCELPFPLSYILHKLLSEPWWQIQSNNTECDVLRFGQLYLSGVKQLGKGSRLLDAQRYTNNLLLWLGKYFTCTNVYSLHTDKV